jgi:signal transduction histidine kinase
MRKPELPGSPPVPAAERGPRPPRPGSGPEPDLELRRLEEQKRQAEIERALAEVQAWVQAMRSSADLVPIIPRMAREIRSLGLEFLTLSIGLIDEATDRVQLFISGREIPHVDVKSHIEGVVPFESDTARRLDREEGPLVITDIPGAADDDVVMYVTASLDSYHGRLHSVRRTTVLSRSEAEVEAIVPKWEAHWGITPWPDELTVRSAVRCPFEGGTIALSDGRAGYLGPREAVILERFAGAFALGYRRYLDFRRLEEQNRELEIARAVSSIQSAVQGMTSSADIVRVITLLTSELRALGMEFTVCAINFEDEEAGRVRSFSTLPFGELPLPVGGRELAFGTHDPSRLEREAGPFWISGIPGAEFLSVLCVAMPADVYHERQGRIGETTVVRRTQAEVERMARSFERTWGLEPWPDRFHFRSSVRAPFEGGVIGVSTAADDAYTRAEADIMTRFAEAFSLGYARYLDFRRLEEQNRMLETANRLKSEFLANMSHEIRTPMNAVINFSSLILDGTYGDISPDLRDAVEEIDRNGSALLVLINDILDLARIEAGAMTLQVEPCRPEACVDGALAALEYDAHEKGLELARVVEEGLPMLECDGRRITQHVLVNLVKNAIKFTPEGGIEVGATRDGEDVHFHVADTGVGIPEHERENIFESFRQVDGSLTREAEGTGLGLTIARKFVELHGGRIWVESEVGRGSTFHFTLPASGG